MSDHAKKIVRAQNAGNRSSNRIEARQKSSGAPFGHKSGFFWQTLQSFIAMHKITQAWAATENRALHAGCSFLLNEEKDLLFLK